MSAPKGVAAWTRRQCHDFTARRRQAPWGRFRNDDAAVSELIGELLLMLVTLALIATIFFVLSEGVEPPAAFEVDLTIRFFPGANSWGNGDEGFRIMHAGGAALGADQARVVFSNGGVLTRFSGDDFGAPWADGLTAGEIWTSPATTINNGTRLVVDVLAFAQGREVLVGHHERTLPLMCPGDTTAPTVLFVTQIPSDVTDATAGPVEVTFVLDDDCAGPDDSVAPTLQHRVYTGSPPAFTVDGPMTLTGVHRWTRSFTETWSSHSGKTLEYQITGMTDQLDNAANSAIYVDQIQSTLPTFTYVNSNVDNTGTTALFANAQADDGLLALLSEGQTGTTPTVQQLNANAVVNAGSWSNAANGFASDDVYATTANNNPTEVRYGLADVVGSPGTVSQVLVKLEGSITNYNNDGFNLQVCSPTTCSTKSGKLGTSLGTDQTMTYDVTSLNPTPGTWTIPQLNAADIRVDGDRTGGRDGTWRIDRAWLEVTFATPVYNMSIDFSFTGVPAGTLQQLELEYQRTGVDFELWVHDGVKYNKRGTLTSTTLTPFTYTLTVAEYRLGSPLIRFYDVTAQAPTTQGTLSLDYARIATTT